MNNYLKHSKGPWKKHKYIRKIGDRYYYTNEEGDINGETDYQGYRNRTVTDANKAAREADKTVGITSKEYREAMGLTSKKAAANNTKSLPKVKASGSKEYEEELAYNSKTNSYPSEMKSITSISNNVDETKSGVKKSEKVLSGISTKISELGTKAKETVEKGKNFLSSIFGEKKTTVVNPEPIATGNYGADQKIHWTYKDGTKKKTGLPNIKK